MGNNWEWIWTFSWSFPLSNLFLSLNLSSFLTNTNIRGRSRTTLTKFCSLFTSLPTPVDNVEDLLFCYKGPSMYYVSMFLTFLDPNKPNLSALFLQNTFFFLTSAFGNPRPPFYWRNTCMVPKKKYVYRWLFHCSLPILSIQCSLWMTPYRKCPSKYYAVASVFFSIKEFLRTSL